MSKPQDTLYVDLEYPRSEDRPKYIQVALFDVRAADDIRVSYDFDRNGWKIEQASVFEWDATDSVCDPCWIEVAFVKAWSQDKGKR